MAAASGTGAGEDPVTARMPSGFKDLLTSSTLISQGAEARVYAGHWKEAPAIIKWRFPKTYRHPELDATLTKARTRAEHRTLKKCAEGGIRVPALLHFDDSAGLVIMEHVQGVTAAEAFRCVAAAGGSLDTLLAVGKDGVTVSPSTGGFTLTALAAAAGKAVAALHNASLVHGDLTTSNIMVLPSQGPEVQVCLIDFGLASRARNRMREELAVDLYVLERAFTSSHPAQGEGWGTLLEAYMGAVSDARVVKARFGAVRARGRKRMAMG